MHSKGNQLVKLYTRGGLAALSIVGAALIAAGCGGSGGGSGATAAAKDAAVLDLVPKSALGYVTIDTDFSGDEWTQFSDLAKAFHKDFKGVDEVIADEAGTAEEGEEKVDFKKDVDPWLGESGGVALLSTKQDDEGDLQGLLAWVELDDTAKFEDFLEDQGFKAGDKVGDYETYENADEESYIGFNDDYGVLTMSRKQLETSLEFDGDSIKDASGVGDAIDEVEGDALATIVLSGEGLRAAAKDNEQLKALAEAKQFKDFHALAISFSAEDDGMRLNGNVQSDGEGAGDNVEPALFNDLPGNTVLAFGGHDFGGGLQSLLEQLGKDSAQVQQGIGAISGVVGVSLDDIAKAFDGEFVLALAAEDEGLGALAGGIAGAAMGGGLDSADPAALVKAGTILLAFEETGESGETLDKIAGAVGGLVGATGAPKAATSGDFETKQLAIQGIPVTTASSDDVAALAVGLDVFENWGGDDALGESDAFTSAWEAADAPDKVLGSMWLDAGRIAKVAGVESGEGVELGGMVGWIESDDSNANFGAFVHVEES